jgi:hypothetical protein
MTTASQTIPAATPTWKDIVNYKHLPSKFTCMATFFKTVVLPSGYPFFLWNDRVYKVEGADCSDTGFTISDIQ